MNMSSYNFLKKQHKFTQYTYVQNNSLLLIKVHPMQNKTNSQMSNLQFHARFIASRHKAQASFAHFLNNTWVIRKFKFLFPLTY